MDFSTDFSFKGSFGVFGSTTFDALIAAARPNTTKSIKLLEPRRFAPCTDAQPASPTAIKPGKILSCSLAVGSKTSPQ